MKTIVVLGMHRSATSLISKGLHASGDVHMNDPTGGLYEDNTISVINDQILQDAGGTWLKPPPEAAILDLRDKYEQLIADYVQGQEEAAEAAGLPFWGWKEPRTSLTIRLWHPHLTNPHYCCQFRHPDGPARNIARSNGIPMDEALEVAYEYNRRIIAFLNDFALP